MATRRRHPTPESPRTPVEREKTFHIHFGADEEGLGCVLTAVDQSQCEDYAIFELPTGSWAGVVDSEIRHVKLQISGKDVSEPLSLAYGAGVEVVHAGSGPYLILDDYVEGSQKVDDLVLRANSFSYSPSSTKGMIAVLKWLPVRKNDPPRLYRPSADTYSLDELKDELHGKVEIHALNERGVEKRILFNPAGDAVFKGGRNDIMVLCNADYPEMVIPIIRRKKKADYGSTIEAKGKTVDPPDYSPLIKPKIRYYARPGILSTRRDSCVPFLGIALTIAIFFGVMLGGRFEASVPSRGNINSLAPSNAMVANTHLDYLRLTPVAGIVAQNALGTSKYVRDGAVVAYKHVSENAVRFFKHATAWCQDNAVRLSAWCHDNAVRLSKHAVAWYHRVFSKGEEGEGDAMKTKNHGEKQKNPNKKHSQQATRPSYQQATGRSASANEHVSAHGGHSLRNKSSSSTIGTIGMERPSPYGQEFSVGLSNQPASFSATTMMPMNATPSSLFPAKDWAIKDHDDDNDVDVPLRFTLEQGSN